MSNKIDNNSNSSTITRTVKIKLKKMRQSTIDNYASAIKELIQTKAVHNYVTRADFDYVAKIHRVTRALPTYLQKVNVIQKVGKNRFKFIKSPTVSDIIKIGEVVLKDKVFNDLKKQKQNNTTQMTIETSVPNVNAITTDSDEFARQAMAYLESRGFKVTKEKFIFPIQTYKSGIKALTSNVYDDKFSNLVNLIAKMENEHIRMAYRAGESGTYKSPEQYLKDEYNDFTA